MHIVCIFLFPVNSVPAHNQSKIIFLCLRPLLPFGVPFAFAYKSSGSKCRLKTCLCLQSSLATRYPRDEIKMQMWCFLIQMNISTNNSMYSFPTISISPLLTSSLHDFFVSSRDFWTFLDSSDSCSFLLSIKSLNIIISAKGIILLFLKYLCYQLIPWYRWMRYDIVLCNSIKESAWIFNNYSVRILFYINCCIALIVSMRQRIEK